MLRPLLSPHGQITDYLTRFTPYDFRQAVIEQSKGSSSELSASPCRPVTPGTPVIDRGFENMIDHKSMINQRIETPVGRDHDDKDSEESHGLSPVSRPFRDGASTPTDSLRNPSGESRAKYLITLPISN